MKKLNSGLSTGVALIASSLLLVACSSKAPVAEAPKPSPAPAVPDCIYPGTQAAAPGWVCDAPVQGYPVSAVGAYEKTSAGVQFQKDQAAAAARVALAARMKTQVANMIKQYVETTGTSDNETVDKVNSSVSKLITNQSVEGAAVIRSMTAPNGVMYVLVAVTDDQLRKNTETAVRTSMKNDQALWQKFQGGKAMDELAAEIARQ